jgi:hypothetical protein
MPITEKDMQEIADLVCESIRSQFKENSAALTSAFNQTLLAKDEGKFRFPIALNAVVSPNGRSRKVKVSFGWGVKNKTSAEMETGETQDMFREPRHE